MGKNRKSNFIPVSLIILILFLINIFGYVALRYYVSDRFFGGDVVNMCGGRSSFMLTGKNIKDPSLFYSSILTGKDSKVFGWVCNEQFSHNAFVYSLLSEKGKEALQRLVEEPADAMEEEAFLLELNKSVIDKKIDWLESFVRKSQEKYNIPEDDTRYYNLAVLSSLYPEYINPDFRFRAGAISLTGNHPFKTVYNSFPEFTYFFTINVPTRYAPLCDLYVSMLSVHLLHHPGNIAVAVFLTGFIYASLMLLVFLLALKFIKSIPWTLAALLLFQASVSTILISYQLFSLPYLFVPLVVTAAVYSYLQYRERGRIFWLISFAFFALIGPWFREFPVIVPFVVFVTEILSFKGKRSRIVLLSCVPLMLHSVYPSLITKLIGLNKGGVYSVFSQNNIKHVTNTVSLNYHHVGFLFVQFPPLLWALLLLSIGLWLWRSFFTDDQRRFNIPIFGRTIGSLAIIFFVGVTVCFGHTFFFDNARLDHPTELENGRYMLLFLAVVVCASFRFNVFLPVFFTAAFLPFLRVGLAELHLSFTLAPLSILFVMWIRDMFSFVKDRLRWQGRKVAVTALSVVLGIGLLDQSLNIPACVFSLKELVKTNKEMADGIRTTLPRHSIVICNFFNFADVFYYSNFYFDAYESVENCPLGPDRVIHKDKDLVKKYKDNLGVRDIYFLAADHDFFNWQKSYHSHKFVKIRQEK